MPLDNRMKLKSARWSEDTPRIPPSIAETPRRHPPCLVSQWSLLKPSTGVSSASFSFHWKISSNAATLNYLCTAHCSAKSGSSVRSPVDVLASQGKPLIGKNWQAAFGEHVPCISITPALPKQGCSSTHIHVTAARSPSR